MTMVNSTCVPNTLDQDDKIREQLLRDGFDETSDSLSKMYEDM